MIVYGNAINGKTLIIKTLISESHFRYGDITPRSTLAKLFSVIWMLAGLVLFAILGSSLITALNAQEMILLQPVQLYNNKVSISAADYSIKLPGQFLFQKAKSKVLMATGGINFA